MQSRAGPIVRLAPPDQIRGGAGRNGCLRRSRVPLRHGARGSDRKGTLIRHARGARPLGTARPVFALAVTMIQPPLRAPLMTAIGAPPLLKPGLGAASRAAIALPAIAVPTDPEHRVAFAAAANPLSENRFAMERHPRRQAALDNGSRSWQVQDIYCATCFQVAERDSAASDGGVPQSFPPARKDHTPTASHPDDRRMTCACGADDAAWVPGRGSENYVFR